jgi:SanA protein
VETKQKRWWRRKMNLILAAVGLVVLSLALITAVNLYVMRVGRSHSVRERGDAPVRQVAIVLGARVFEDGGMAAMTSDRVETAAELYHRGLVKKLLISGDHGREDYDEVNTMRAAAEECGVPPQDIFLDHAGFSTYETMCRARKIFGVESALVVTQKFHLPRAVYLAGQFGIDAVGVPADRQSYKQSSFHAVREILARCKAYAQVIAHSSPRFLGDTYDITGDGRVTWDKLD